MLWLVSPAAPMWRTLQNSDMWQLLQWIVVFHCLFFVLIFICARSSSFYTWALGIVSIQASRLARLVFQEPFICFQRALLQTKNINNHGFLGTSSALFVSFLSSLIFLWGPPPPPPPFEKEVCLDYRGAQLKLIKLKDLHIIRRKKMIESIT